MFIWETSKVVIFQESKSILVNEKYTLFVSNMSFLLQSDYMYRLTFNKYLKYTCKKMENLGYFLYEALCHIFSYKEKYIPFFT